MLLTSSAIYSQNVHFNDSTKMKTLVGARDWALGEGTDHKEAQRNFLM